MKNKGLPPGLKTGRQKKGMAKYETDVSRKDHRAGNPTERI